MEVVVIGHSVEATPIVLAYTLLCIKTDVQSLFEQRKPLGCNTKKFHMALLLVKTDFLFLLFCNKIIARVKENINAIFDFNF